MVEHFDPITEDYLKACGFKKTWGRAWQGGEESKHRVLTLPRVASDFGLAVELAPNDIMKDGTWFCWLVQDEPYRFIPLRHLRYMTELAFLIQGLTGENWHYG